MKYCSKCGKEVEENATYCLGCGCAVNEEAAPAEQTNVLKLLTKIFMIIGVVGTSVSTYALGLIWCLPMWKHWKKCVETGTPVSTGFKVCTLLFVSMPAGIMMLCDND